VIRSVTIKLVGYAEAVRFLDGRFRSGAAVVLFGGLAKERLPGLHDGHHLQRRTHRAGQDARRREAAHGPRLTACF